MAIKDDDLTRKKIYEARKDLHVERKQRLEKKNAVATKTIKEKLKQRNKAATDRKLHIQSLDAEKQKQNQPTASDIENATKRKQKSTGKRKGSGLVPKSIYLTEKTHDRFKNLASKLGYDIGEKGLSSEQLSMLVHFLLDDHEKPKDINVPLTAEGQYLYRIHQILKYRSKEMNDTIEEIISFMVNNKYTVPDRFIDEKLSKAYSKYGWTSKIVRTLLNKEQLNTELDKLNKPSHVSIKKRLSVKRKARIKAKPEDYTDILKGSIFELPSQNTQKNESDNHQQKKPSAQDSLLDDFNEGFSEFYEPDDEINTDIHETYESSSNGKKRPTMK
ncbi:TPA: hypothetical protein NKO64_001829 [Vibrio parahaemolyticus]|nr:hypothetical protein [Vibrio parahaemolyticus]